MPLRYLLGIGAYKPSLRPGKVSGAEVIQPGLGVAFFPGQFHRLTGIRMVTRAGTPGWWDLLAEWKIVGLAHLSHNAARHSYDGSRAAEVICRKVLSPGIRVAAI